MQINPNVLNMTYHLELPNPDDPFGMPLFDSYGDTWDDLVRIMTERVEPGRYDAIRTFTTTTGESDDCVELVQHGTFYLYKDNLVVWCERYNKDLLA